MRNVRNPNQRKQGRILGISIALVFLVVIWFTYLPLSNSNTNNAHRISQSGGGPSTMASQCLPLEIDNSNQGFIDVPVESTILMLFSPTASDGYCYYPDNLEEFLRSNREGKTSSCVLNMRRMFESSFQQAGAAFVTDYRIPHAPFFDFFPSHSATFWEVDGGGVARPLLLDIVYTYVNPASSSMKRNLEARGLAGELTERRYTDWNELRYSFRGLHRFVLENPWLHQAVDQLQEDIQFLQGLGLTVPEDVTMKADVLRDVILLLADEDQVPDWLNTSKFPKLKVVTHRSMFSAPNESFILPTLNSNVIEGGIHRIPGISKYYLYFNNDMFVSRNITMFDIFRPLSPPRQELHFTAMVSKWGTSFESLQNCKLAAVNRTMLFLEPIMHNYGDEYYSPFNATLNASLAASCVYHKGEDALNHLAQSKKKSGDAQNISTRDMIKFADVTGLDSRKALGFSFPFSCDIPPGLGAPSTWYLSLMRNTVNGFDSPSGFAHIPQLFNRETAYAINEVDLLLYSNATRQAFIREQFPFSTVDVYVGFALGMVRARERYLWDQIWRHVLPNITVAENQKDLRFPWIDDVAKLVEEKDLVDHHVHPLSNKKLRVSDCGALYGPGNQALLQSPQFFEELVLWWDASLRPGAGDGENVKWLSQLYQFPSVQGRRGSGAGAGGQDSSVRSATLSCGDGHFTAHPTLPEQFKILLQDARTHLGSTPTYRFEMLEGGVKPLAVLGRLKQDKIHHTMPLWVNLNDNFHSTGKKEDELLQKGLFKVLMTILSNYSGPAPWEIADLPQNGMCCSTGESE